MMADDLFALLIEARNAAETADANAQNIIRACRRKPDFSFAVASNSPQTRQAQVRAAARKWIRIQHENIKRLYKARTRFREVREADVDALALIRRATALRVKPIQVGDYTYPTAHEAAEALGDLMCEVWHECSGDSAVELAPDRLQAEWDESDSADIAIEVSVDIWRRLRRLRKQNGLPSDLDGQIQQEFEAAADRLIEETAPSEPEGASSTPSITSEEANQTAMKLAKQDPAFLNGVVRDWAAAIRKATGKTCSIATVKATRLWRETMKATGRGRSKGKAPQAVSFTENLEAVTGSGRDQQILEDLIAEQEADNEPSPVDGDRPNPRRKTKHYKRV
jgi:hypothetical protein